MKNLFWIFLIIYGISSTAFSQQHGSRIEKLSKNSDLILTGKVVHQNSSWNENKTRIYTKATLKVDEYLKGNNAGNSVEVIYPGGEVDGVGELYSHMPRFNNDEEVLVFLKKDKKKTDYKVFAGEEGKITVINDSKTGEKITSSNVKIEHLKAQIKSYLKEK
jgi:hypothetical protein